MKVLLVHLSMLAFLQVLLVGFGASLYKEYLKETPDKGQMAFFFVMFFTAFLIAAIMYFNVYWSNTKNKK